LITVIYRESKYFEGSKWAVFCNLLLPKGNLNGKEVNQGKGMKEIREVQKQKKT
jgi:hypothetical protein